MKKDVSEMSLNELRDEYLKNLELLSFKSCIISEKNELYSRNEVIFEEIELRYAEK